jgi:hypothetical protein
MRRRLLLLPLLAMLAPGAASACSMHIPRQPSPAEEAAAARQTVHHAGAIIDGEVIRPFVPGRAAALVRVHRQFTGPRQSEFQVGVLTTCDVPLMRVGERARMILTGGPEIWFIRMGTLSAAAVDRVLGSDRRRDWPYARGVVVAP